MRQRKRKSLPRKTGIKNGKIKSHEVQRRRVCLTVGLMDLLFCSNIQYFLKLSSFVRFHHVIGFIIFVFTQVKLSHRINQDVVEVSLIILNESLMYFSEFRC